MLVFKSYRKNPAGNNEVTPSERRVQALVMEAMRKSRASVTSKMRDWEALVANSSADRVSRELDVEPWLGIQERLRDELLAELLDAGSRVRLPMVQKALDKFVFDRDRPEAARWADLEAGKLIVEVTDGQRALVRDVVSRAQLGQLTPQQVARQIRDNIGLTSRQAGWVTNKFDWALDSNLQAGMGLTEATAAAERLTERYQETVMRYRSETIARTEIMRAASEGRREAWNQGLQEGFINPGMMQEWDATLDPCDDCQAIAGQRIPVVESWPLGDPPLHPNCRCDLILVDDIGPEVAALNEDELDALINDLLGDDVDVTGGDILDVVDNPGTITEEIADVVDTLQTDISTPTEIAVEDIQPERLVDFDGTRSEEIETLHEQLLEQPSIEIASTDEARRRYENMVRDYEDFEERAFGRWQGNGYTEIQEYIYNKETNNMFFRPDDFLEEIISVMDESMSYLPTDTVLYRGQTTGLQGLNIGDTLTPRGFAGCSTDLPMAGEFSKSAGRVVGPARPGDTLTVMRIRGDNLMGVAVPESFEMEVIISRSHTLEVVGFDTATINDVTYKIVDVVVKR